MLHIPAAEHGLRAVGAAALPFVTADRISGVHQLREVAPDRFTVGRHAVIPLQDADYVLLRKAVVFVGILFQYLKNIQNKQLFRLETVFHRIRTLSLPCEVDKRRKAML